MPGRTVGWVNCFRSVPWPITSSPGKRRPTTCRGCWTGCAPTGASTWPRRMPRSKRTSASWCWPRPTRTPARGSSEWRRCWPGVRAAGRAGRRSRTLRSRCSPRRCAPSPRNAGATMAQIRSTPRSAARSPSDSRWRRCSAWARPHAGCRFSMRKMTKSGCSRSACHRTRPRR